LSSKVNLDATYENSVFQPFSSCGISGTFETLLSVWRYLHTQNNANLRILTEPSEECEAPLGSAEPRLKNTVVEDEHFDNQNNNVKDLGSSRQQHQQRGSILQKF